VIKQTFDAKLGQEVTYRVFDLIQKHVAEFNLVGSLGRKEKRICDVDILVKLKDGDFSIEAIRGLLKKNGEWVKGGMRNMVVDKVFGSELRLDLFLCHAPAQWGVLTAVRLNPIPLVIHGKELIDVLGYERKGGAIYANDVPLELSLERDWFNLINIPYVPPEDRWELTRDLRLI